MIVEFELDPKVAEEPPKFKPSECEEQIRLAVEILSAMARGLSPDTPLERLAALRFKAWRRTHQVSVHVVPLHAYDSFWRTYLPDARSIADLPIEIAQHLDSYSKLFYRFDVCGRCDEGTLFGRVFQDDLRILIARWCPEGSTLGTFDQMIAAARYTIPSAR